MVIIAPSGVENESGLGDFVNFYKEVTHFSFGFVANVFSESIFFPNSQKIASLIQLFSSLRYRYTRLPFIQIMQWSVTFNSYALISKQSVT